MTATPTPSAGAVTNGRYRIGWQKTAQTAQKVSAGALAAMAAGYGKALTGDYAIDQQVLQRDLLVLRQVSDTYGKSFAAALTKVGVDVAQLQKDLEAFGELTDQQEIAAAKKALDARYLPYYPKAFAAAEMNRNAIVNTMAQQIRPQVSDPKSLTPTLTGAQLTWGWTGLGTDGSTTPSNCAPEQTFTAPYSLFAASNDTDATPNPDLVLRAQWTVAGDIQETRSRGVIVVVDRSATQLRVVADITMNSAYLYAFAFLGYASAEIIVRLQLFEGATPLHDGATPIVEQQRSLARKVATVIGDDDTRLPAGPLQLAVDYALPTGASADTPADTSADTTLSAVVQVEGWAGCGGPSGALASFAGTLDRIRVFTTC